MTAQLLEKVTSTPEQYFILPGWQSWEQFKAMQAAIAEVPGARITYLDGRVELMTTGEEHEMIKSSIGFLLELYFCELEIEYFPAGSATRESETSGVSFEPDESYYLGQKAANPDLAVEVVITSGGKGKLEKYKRLKIAEVWFWQNNRLSIYRFRGQEYERVSRSELLPDLDLDLLISCVLMPSRVAAKKEFIKGIQQR